MVKTRFFIRFEDTKRTDEQGTVKVVQQLIESFAENFKITFLNRYATACFLLLEIQYMV